MNKYLLLFCLLTTNANAHGGYQTYPPSEPIPLTATCYSANHKIDPIFETSAIIEIHFPAINIVRITHSDGFVKITELHNATCLLEYKK